MHKNKVIILAIGTVILIALSIAMFYLEGQGPNSISDTGPEVSQSGNEENQETSEQGSTSSTPEGNINQGDDTGQVTDNTIEGEGQDTLRRYAKESISESNFTSESSNLTQESLLNQSKLAQTYYLKQEESTIGSENIETEAKLISLELIGWKEHAEENYSFTYSFDDFIEFLNQEEYLEEDSNEPNDILLEELKKTDEELYHRQLELQYLKPFIWDSIESEIAPEGNTEDNNNKYFNDFEQQILGKIFEENPQLIEDDN
ncbi:hypothetical protein CR203_13310 [Salipaludibacillus neizhouensis]|uniref:Uncharacterized protein n=1 Tax=Salipaludibacillus neizhouensis TaxID=885475 RepID=A0A3A9K5Y0_9BACI|nr:hypothetical protein [Salipaludibacillus neizhouensis]RKL66808.1 hypothetical protein CR203_13310 [Salipaludibacillus neizhouensis]